MISNLRENDSRLFIISYFLSEDKISVYEIPCRNLGFVAGEFLGKSKYHYPGQQKFSSNRPIAYKSQDFYIGATVTLTNFTFKVISADMFGLKFMEDHKDLYPMSNAHIILSKVREKLRPMYKDFIARYMTKVKILPGSTECMSNEDFRSMLIDLLNESIVEHEIVTLCRHFAIKDKKSPYMFRENIRSMIQMEIVRGLWEDIERTREFIHHLSPNNVQHLSEEKTLKVIRGCRVPIDKMQVEQMFKVLERNEKNEISVEDLFLFLDVKSTSKAALSPPVNPKKNQFDFETEDSNFIDWNKLVASIDLEESLTTSE